MRNSPCRSNVPGEHVVRLLFEGLNGGDLIKLEGKGVSVTAPRSGEGAYTLTIARDNPGEFKGWSWALGADTPADVAGHTVVRDTPVAWTGTVWTMPFVIYNSSFAADDLLDNEYLDLSLYFGMKDS